MAPAAADDSEPDERFAEAASRPLPPTAKNLRERTIAALARAALSVLVPCAARGGGGGGGDEPPPDDPDDPGASPSEDASEFVDDDPEPLSSSNDASDLMVFDRQGMTRLRLEKSGFFYDQPKLSPDTSCPRTRA